MGIAATDEVLAAELFGPITAKGAPRRPAIPPAPLAVQQWLAFIASWWWLNILIENFPVRVNLSDGLHRRTDYSSSLYAGVSSLPRTSAT